MSNLFVRYATVSIVILITARQAEMQAQVQRHDRILYRNDVYINGQDGYSTYRIPAMVVTRKGTVLAFCEGRKNGHEDTGDIDLLLKRSFDGGRTWTAQQVVYEEGGNQPVTIGNPVPIVDKVDGTIHFFFTRDYRSIFYTRSSDDGITWSAPKEFSEILAGFDYPVVVVATGPVHGIHTNTGRLIVPVWVCDRTRKERYKNVTNDRMRAGIIYSDDSGFTWQTGGLVPTTIGITHEATVTEREDGVLLINTRTYNELYRAESISMDGGLTWEASWLNEDLPDPTCQGSMFKTSGGLFLFLNPAVAYRRGIEARKNLTLRISRDEGRSWPDSITLNPGPAGYSDIAEMEDGRILCLFENGTSLYREKISVVVLKRFE